MKLESIKIKNIRSIKNLDVTFPLSSILFYGDIGSGKSSVLKAMEFALFGTLNAADLKGESLLRRGENKGSVELTFSIDDIEYTVIRGLSKSKKDKISQTKGALIEDGKETSYSVKELRKKVLELLNYSVSRYENAHKIPIFRYTVYTPQESIKEILQANPSERFEILKDVFGIEKYEIALRNVDVLGSYLRDQLNECQGKLKQIGEPEELVPQKESELKDQDQKIKKIEQDVTEKLKEVTNLKSNQQEIEKELEEFSQRLIEIQNKEKIIKEAQESKANNEQKLKNRAKELKENRKELSKIPEIPIDFKESQEELENKVKVKRKEITESEKEKAVISKSINDIDKLLKEGKCSLCGQEIHEKARFEKELKKSNSDIELLANKIESSIKEIEILEKKLKDLIKFTQNKSRKELYEKLIDGIKKNEEEIKTQIKKIELRIRENQKEVEDALKKYKIKDLEKFKELDKEIRNRLNETKKCLENVQSEESALKAELSAENKTLEYIKKGLEELKKEIELKKVLKEKVENLNSLKDWIKEAFPVLIRDIEREILSSSARHFNEYFKNWFNLLIDQEDIEVEIRPEDFEPVIMVNGYESPFFDMSGGEKSALSLAYRLTLNKIINERYHEVKTSDLLILDEPTDGFSQQQINKMQDLFDSLNTKQLIIISHDRALDSFVTDILNFEKRNHVTTVK